MKDLLKYCMNKFDNWIELRYHHRERNVIFARGGRIDMADSMVRAGVGVRALVDGSFGFSSTDSLTQEGIMKAAQEAIDHARVLSRLKNSPVAVLPTVTMATEDNIAKAYNTLVNMQLQDKMDAIIDMERQGRTSSQLIKRSTCHYEELLEDKVIVTSDGACAQQKLAQPSVSISIIAEKDGQQSAYNQGIGVSGDWDCLFNHPHANGIVDRVAGLAVDLLSAGYAVGGTQTAILSPSLVGLLSHEAIGHTVEADFVQSGSVAQGKIGQRVGSELVTLCDSGIAPFGNNPAGEMVFDDEGVPCQTVAIIDRGILNSYLHNRDSAAIFKVSPTGNGRAWEFDSDPIIRMRNTYIEPGTDSLEEIIAETKDGVLLEGAGSGQADATGEFMFGVGHGVEIKNGKLGKLFRQLTVSGVAFDVLQTVDRISSEFIWDLGTGYCGKIQRAKVDAGGPYLRCKATLGGREKT